MQRSAQVRMSRYNTSQMSLTGVIAGFEPHNMVERIEAITDTVLKLLFEQSKLPELFVVRSLYTAVHDSAESCMHVTWMCFSLSSQGFQTGRDGRVRERVLSMTANNGTGAAAYQRLVAVLSLIHEYLREGKRPSQRDIWYR